MALYFMLKLHRGCLLGKASYGLESLFLWVLDGGLEMGQTSKSLKIGGCRMQGWKKIFTRSLPSKRCYDGCTYWWRLGNMEFSTYWGNLSTFWRKQSKSNPFMLLGTDFVGHGIKLGSTQLRRGIKYCVKRRTMIRHLLQIMTLLSSFGGAFGS